MHLVLASSSLGRKHLLKKLKVSFDIFPSKIEEESILGSTPLSTLKKRAKAKGEDVYNRFRISEFGVQKLITNDPALESFLILSADSGAIINNQLIGKPKNKKHAEKILKTLSGKTHKFVTAIYIIQAQILSPQSKTGSDPINDIKYTKRFNNISKGIVINQKYGDVYISKVTFRKLSKNDINRFLDVTDFQRYAAGYAIVSAQDFITKIEGSLSNVVGLPLEIIIPIFMKNKIL